MPRDAAHTAEMNVRLTVALKCMDAYIRLPPQRKRNFRATDNSLVSRRSA